MHAPTIDDTYAPRLTSPHDALGLSRSAPLGATLALLVIGLLAPSGCGGDDEQTPAAFPATLKVQQTGFYPEGIAYSRAKERIYLGSFYLGKVVSFDAQGVMRSYIDDPQLVSVVGLAVDEANHRLVVTNSDIGRGERSSQATAFQLGEVRTYDLDSGALVHATNLAAVHPGPQFINDVVTDGAGTIYATNSADGVIYRIAPDGTGSVLIEDAALAPPAPGEFGTNGIAYHPHGYLIVSKGAQLLKVPLDDPSKLQPIAVDQPLNAIDGLLLLDDGGTLVVVSNNLSGQPYPEAVYRLRSTDGWGSASVDATFTALADTMPTTAALVGDHVYVTHANFGTLEAFFSQPGSPLSDSFVVQRIAF
jgi:sugar lactone lactonase YvrE